jgi:hypothetical protein
MVVYIVRHGERLDNVDETFLQTSETPWNPPLTENGKQQAVKTGKFLKDKNISTIYTSPFLRCVQTTIGILEGMECTSSTTTTSTTTETTETTAPLVVVKVEAGLGEFLNANWFDKDPVLPPSTWEHLPGLDPTYESVLRPVYPETSTAMMVRYSRIPWVRLSFQISDILSSLSLSLAHCRDSHH